MGLSASQARLLSITARLTDNELHSQMIANSKVRLADQTQQASADYIKALDTSKLVYTTYDTNGEQKCVELTPGLMYTYAPLKNQYAMMNPSGQIMVSNVDAKNYENTNSLAEFLECYGVKITEDKTPIYETKTRIVPNVETYTYQEEEIVQVKNPAYDAWHERHDGKEPPKQEDYYQKPVHVPKWELVPSEESTNMFDQFVYASSSCYSIATNIYYSDVSPCYIHILGYLLDLSLKDDCSGYDNTKYPKYYTATTGDTTSLAKYDEKPYDLYWYEDKTPIMVPISDAVCNGFTNSDGEKVIIYAAEHPYNAAEDDEEWEKLLSDYYIQNTESPTMIQTLLSNYYRDPADGSIKPKLLKQKCIDMLLIMQTLRDRTPGTLLDEIIEQAEDENKFYCQIMKPYISSFQEDMEVSLYGARLEDHGTDIMELDEDAYEEALSEWNEPEPDEYLEDKQMVTKTGERTINVVEHYEELVGYDIDIKVDDKDKSQWYANLWNAMNGSKTANLVTPEDDMYATNETGIYRLNGLVAAEKSLEGGKYKVLDENLMNSTSWLKFALEQGVISLAKAEYTVPTNDSEKALELSAAGVTWQYIGYSSASDIHEVDDEKAIAKAEAEYTKKLNEIEAKDKQYDNDLKKLDTEHNALLTEYESIANVIGKNVERSFKAFS